MAFDPNDWQAVAEGPIQAPVEPAFSNFIMPLAGDVTSGYGASRAGGRTHHAYDIAGAPGAPVVAPGRMRLAAGRMGGTNLRPNDWWSHWDELDEAGQPTGRQYRFAHHGPLRNKVGDIVEQGQEWGSVGNAIKGTHLHMAMRQGGQPFDWLGSASQGVPPEVAAIDYEIAAEKKASKIAAQEVPPEVAAIDKELGAGKKFDPADWSPVEDFVPVEEAVRPGTKLPFGLEFGKGGGPLEAKTAGMAEAIQSPEGTLAGPLAGTDVAKWGKYGFWKGVSSLQDFAGKFTNVLGAAADVMGPGAAAVHGFEMKESPYAEGFAEAAYGMTAEKHKGPVQEAVNPIRDFFHEQAKKIAPKGQPPEKFADKVVAGAAELPGVLAKYAIPVGLMGPALGMGFVDAVDASDKSPMEIISSGVQGLLAGKVLGASEVLKLPSRMGAIGSMFGLLAWANGGDAQDISSSTVLGAFLASIGGKGDVSAKQAIGDAFGQFRKEYNKLDPAEKKGVWQKLWPSREEAQADFDFWQAELGVPKVEPEAPFRGTEKPAAEFEVPSRTKFTLDKQLEELDRRIKEQYPEAEKPVEAPEIKPSGIIKAPEERPRPEAFKPEEWEPLVPSYERSIITPEEGGAGSLTFGVRQKQNVVNQLKDLESEPLAGPAVDETKFYSGGPDTREWLTRMAPIWKSRMQEFVSTKLPGKGTGEGLASTMQGWADKGMFKKDELKWSGLVPWLKEQKGPVTKQQVMDYLKGEGQVEVREVVKGGREADWAEFPDWLREETELGPDDFSDQELQHFRDRYRSERPELDLGTKFQSYMQLPPGGENWREVLLTVPAERPKAHSDLDAAWGKGLYALQEAGVSDLDAGSALSILTKNDPALVTPILNFVKSKAPDFDWSGYIETAKKANSAAIPERFDISEHKPSHAYGDPAADVNRFAHVFMDDRIIDGKKYLTIWEMQSDWAAEGRKKGYARPKEEIEDELLKTKVERDRLLDQSGFGKIRENIRSSRAKEKRLKEVAIYERQSSGMLSELTKQKLQAADDLHYNDLVEMNRWKESNADIYEKILEIERRLEELKQESVEEKIPQFPFPKTWHEVALKKMLRKAAEEGYDGVAWATGDMVKERYDLSRHVSRVEYFPNTKSLYVYDLHGDRIIEQKNTEPSQIEQYIGEDPAVKLLESKPVMMGLDADTPVHTIDGEDLRIGGEWANRLYDQTVPQFLKRYGKQWGASPGEKKISAAKGVDQLEVVEEEGGRFDVVDRNDPTDMPIAQFNDPREAIEFVSNYVAESGTEPIHTLDFTEPMKKTVLREGQYMFSGGPDTSEWFKNVWNDFKADRQARGSMLDFDDLSAKASGLWEKLKRPFAEQTPYQRTIDDYLGNLQIAGVENERLIARVNKAVPDKVDQEAITNWIQAGGDPQLLRARAEATKDPKLKAGYVKAINLGPEQLAVAREAVAFYDKMLKEGQEAGLIEHALDHYINQVWEKHPDVAQRLRGEVNAGLLNENFSYARKRIWDTYFDGEQMGRIPKDKSVSFLMGNYFASFHKAVAARQAMRELTNGLTKDGMPILSPVGGGSPVPRRMPEESRAFEDVPGEYDMTGKPEGPEAYLIKPHQMTDEQMANYKYIPHPALRKWKWIGNDFDGKPMLLQGDLWVHKDHYKHLKNMLSRSAIRETAGGRALMHGVQSLKQTLLSISPFHQVHVMSHGIMHMVNIADLPEIDFDKRPLLKEGVRHGLMLYDPRGLGDFSEGVKSGGIISKVPGVGGVAVRYGNYLFHDLIPRLKGKLFEEAFERNLKRYSDKWSRDEIAALSANQSNAAFGELNYKSMGRNPTMQDIFRLMALAPDFLEARIRFAGQAFKPGGKEQAYALLRGAIGLAGIGMIGSALFGNKEHGELGGWNWKDPFSLHIGDKKYTIRSVPGDIYHLFSNPRNFVYWRLNPSTVRAGVEMVSGRDIFGRKRSFPQQLGDYFVSHTPIPLQPLTPTMRRDQTLLDGALRMVGVSSYKHRTPAGQAMLDYFSEMRIDRPADSEQIALSKGRQKVLELARSGKEDEALDEIQKVAKEYKLPAQKALNWLMEAQYPENIANFRRLPLEVMAKVIDLAEPAEEEACLPILISPGAFD